MMFLVIILLSAHIYTVSSASVVDARNRCREGDPLPGNLFAFEEKCRRRVCKVLTIFL